MQSGCRAWGGVRAEQSTVPDEPAGGASSGAVCANTVVTEHVPVPQEMHGALIGKGGATI